MTSSLSMGRPAALPSAAPAEPLLAFHVVTKKTIDEARYGVPEHLRSDNGPEFIAFCIQDWLKAQAIKTLYHQGGEPLGERAY